MLDIIKEYLSVNLKDYESFDVDFEINKFLVILAVAMCVAFFVINYNHHIISQTIKQLFRHGAFSEDSAKTLSELRLADSCGIKKALLNNSQLRRMVAIVGEVKPTYDEYVAKNKKIVKPNVDDARIYIRPESLDRAKQVFNTYNSSIFRTLLVCILCIAVTVCLILVMPEILSLFDSAIKQ